MRCICCSENNWENVDQYRVVPKGMSLCLSCGMVSYPDKWKTEEEIKKHYRTEYRKPPTAMNFYTGQRKTHYHNAFLKDVFKEWKEIGKQHPSVYEIGAAYGLALGWFKQAYPGCKVGGTELTTSYKRNAFYEFGIVLDDDFNKEKHDLIMSYKVAEHQLDADKRLSEYFDSMGDDSYLYISVPTWFDSMTNFGLGGFDLEYYYSPDHINVWTREHFENILERAGFEILKKDYIMYDSTYLCKKNASKKETPIYKVTPDVIKDKLARIKDAFEFMNKNNPEAAIERWPDYHQAWATIIEKERRQLFEKGWDYIKTDFIPKMLSACNNTAMVWVSITDLAMRAKQWEDAIKYCENGLRACPENPSSLQQLMLIMREIALKAADENERNHYWEQARNVARHGRNISAEHFQQFTDHVYLFNSQLPVVENQLQLGGE